MYIPFEVSCGLFALLNMVGSVHRWYVTGRSTMLITGALDSLVGALGVCVYPHDIHLAHFCASAGSITAGLQFSFHGMRSSRLWRATPMNLLYGTWVLGLFKYGYDCGRYAWVLRFD